MKIAIVGLGLIGSSLARRLHDHHEISGIDRDAATIAAASQEGVIARGGDDPALARGCDTVVICLPVAAIVPAARELVAHLEPGAVLTDTGSTKARIVSEIEALWPDFVGSHPMAGTEHSGYAAGFAELFDGALNIITPTGRTSGAAIERVRDLWRDCGARSISMDPAGHDEVMARVSHMPHLLSFAFMPIMDADDTPPELLGKGFKDFTRIAASDPVMWRDIFLENRANLLPLLEQYLAELREIKRLLQADEGDALEELLRQQRAIRKRLYDYQR